MATETIAVNTNLVIDFGGGLKSENDLKIAFNSGAEMITGGSIAVKEQETFLSWLEKFGAETWIAPQDPPTDSIPVTDMVLGDVSSTSVSGTAGFDAAGWFAAQEGTGEISGSFTLNVVDNRSGTALESNEFELAIEVAGVERCGSHGQCAEAGQDRRQEEGSAENKNG